MAFNLCFHVNRKRVNFETTTETISRTSLSRNTCSMCCHHSRLFQHTAIGMCVHVHTLLCLQHVQSSFKVVSTHSHRYVCTCTYTSMPAACAVIVQGCFNTQPSVCVYMYIHFYACSMCSHRSRLFQHTAISMCVHVHTLLCLQHVQSSFKVVSTHSHRYVCTCTYTSMPAACAVIVQGCFNTQPSVCVYMYIHFYACSMCSHRSRLFQHTAISMCVHVHTLLCLQHVQSSFKVVSTHSHQYVCTCTYTSMPAACAVIVQGCFNTQPSVCVYMYIHFYACSMCSHRSRSPIFH